MVLSEPSNRVSRKGGRSGHLALTDEELASCECRPGHGHAGRPAGGEPFLESFALAKCKKASCREPDDLCGFCELVRLEGKIKSLLPACICSRVVDNPAP